MFKCLCILMHCVVVLKKFTGVKCTIVHHLPKPSNRCSCTNFFYFMLSSVKKSHRNKSIQVKCMSVLLY